ncbi:MAG: fructose-6-phosphate aldolase [Holosporales bacterium]
MKFFVDSADTEEIAQLAEYGLVDGVTTNPTLIAKSGRNIAEVIAEICKMIKGPVSAEVTATTWQEMMREGDKLAHIAENVCIKVPLTPDGLRACRDFTRQGIQVNVTLCFTATQALLAAKAGATFISPFLGRLDDLAQDGLTLIEDIVCIYDNYEAIHTQILAASIRSPLHVAEVAKRGADVATLPPKIFHQLFQHPLTQSGLEAFLKDWAATGQRIA